MSDSVARIGDPTVVDKDPVRLLPCSTFTRLFFFLDEEFKIIESSLSCIKIMADGPTLQHVLAGQHEGSVTCSMFVTEVGGTGGDTGVLTTAEDKVLLVWLLRDNGEYYPSARKDLPAVGRTISFDQDANRIYVGLDDGKIMVRKPRPRCLLQTSPPPSSFRALSYL